MRVLRLATAALIVLMLLLASCGRKAPPRLPVYERPPAPSSLEAIHREGTVVLTWDYPSRKLRYVREFQVVRSGKTLDATEETSYTDADIGYGKRYDYTVFAVSTGGIISEGSAQLAVEVIDVPPAPQGLRAEVVAKGVRLTWGHPEEGRLYNVYRSYAPPLDLLRPINREPLREAEFVDNPLMERPVYYTVRALAGGAERHEGPASEVVEMKPEAFVPSAPEGLRAVVAGDKVLLAWKESPEAWVRAYKVYRAVEGGDYVLIGESRTPSFIDGAVPLGAVSYKVRAVGPSMEGHFSGAAAPEEK